jgi:hypothetical protein
LLVGAWVALALRDKGRHLGANLAVAFTAVAFFVCAHTALKVFSTHLSSKELAEAIEVAARPTDPIVINGEYESGSTLNFYARRQVYILNGRSANLWFGSFYPDAPHIFLEDQDLVKLWHTRNRVFLFTEEELKPKLDRLLGPTRLFARSGGKLILVNR